LFLHGQDKEQFLTLIDSPELNLQEGISQGWFYCHSALETYSPNANFLISEMYEKLTSATKLAIQDGYTGLSAAGQMTWANEAKIRSEVLAEYEYGLNSIFENQPKLRGLCLYSQEDFQPHDITLQCLCHPTITTQGGKIANPYSEFENIEHRQSIPKIADIRMYWNNIRILSNSSIEALTGKKALFARKILERVRSNLYVLFAEDPILGKTLNLLAQIDLLSQKIDYLCLKESSIKD